MLRSHDDIGLTGPINNNNRILTQAFVSRKHMEIFGWFFPEQIINWCCDDWYNLVYQPTHFFPIDEPFCSNNGGSPRYDVNNNPQFLEHGNGAENTRKLDRSQSPLQMNIVNYWCDIFHIQTIKCEVYN